MIGTILKESLKGKSIARTLANCELLDKHIEGVVLDIGGGKNRASHYRFINLDTKARIQTANLDQGAEPDYILDIEKDRIPKEDNTYDFVLSFNTLEHIYNQKHAILEAFRVLKTGGTLLGSIPFLVNFHPDPNDYSRLTQQGISRLLKECGFRDAVIVPVGRGPFTAAYAQVEFMLPRIIRVIKIPIVFFFDRLVGQFTKFTPRVRFPLAYVFYAKK